MRIDAIRAILNSLMPRKRRKSEVTHNSIQRYDAILAEVVDLLEGARRLSARAVNAVITTTYWRIGQRIVEAEQKGSHKATYGEHLIERLSQDLTRNFGRGFSKR